MKNLKVLFQKSILIFAVLFFSSCSREDEVFVPTSLPFESLQILPNESQNPQLPTLDFDIPGHARYLTLYDVTKQNSIVIKVKTEDKILLNSLNSETVHLITFTRSLPVDVPDEKSNTFALSERSELKPIEIEVIETKIQKNVRFYGIRFVKTELIIAAGSYTFTYINTNVNAVNIIATSVIKDLSRFTVFAMDCQDCERVYLAPRNSVANNLISFRHDKKSKIALQVKSKFTDDIQMVW